jgi:membrane protease YdiL (CAAX protease family)
MEANRIELKPLALALVAVSLGELAAGLLISLYPAQRMILLGAVRLLQTLLILLALAVWGPGLSALGLAPAGMLSGIKKGAYWSAGFAVSAALASGVLFLAGFDPLMVIHTQLPAKTTDLVFLFMVGGLVGPVAEEVFFRGVLYGFFRRWGVAAAILLTTAVFVLVHPVGSGMPLTQVIGGIVFAVAYEVEKNLMVPTVIHVSGNLAIFSLAFVH